MARGLWFAIKATDPVMFQFEDRLRPDRGGARWTSSAPWACLWNFSRATAPGVSNTPRRQRASQLARVRRASVQGATSSRIWSVQAQRF